jgi:hypothetical protein
MMSPDVVRGYTQRSGAQYVEMDATHFLLIEKQDAMTDAMARWLSARFAP